MKISLTAAATAVALSFAASAFAAGPDIVKNGSFSQVTGGTNGAGQLFDDPSVSTNYKPAYSVQVTDWLAPQTSYNGYAPFDFVQKATLLGNGDPGGVGFPDSTNSAYRKLWGDIPAPPVGGPNVMVLDADYHITPLYQVITPGDLKDGQTYTITFAWAQAQWAQNTGNTTSGLEVGLGGQVIQVVPASPSETVQHQLTLPSSTFGGWNTYTATFTYEGNDTVMHYASNEVGQTFTAQPNWLTFIAEGTPIGVPPTILLSGVSLSAPEPATWALMILGVGAVGGVLRRRRALAVA